jgi:hypothetical protein
MREFLIFYVYFIGTIGLLDFYLNIVHPLSLETFSQTIIMSFIPFPVLAPIFGFAIIGTSIHFIINLVTGLV